jgi:hypothetical protein
MSNESLTVDSRSDASIDASKEVDLNDWSNRFGVTRDQLRTAIAAVGGRVTDVERYLASHVTVTA